MLRNVCVYCSSSNAIAPAYFEVATTMGRLLGEGGYTLVYGGGNVGLMGTIARAVHEHGGQVLGVIPEALKRREGVAYEVADRLVTTPTIQKRKQVMFQHAEAFLVLPGGFGTLEEFLEVLTLKQLGYHSRALALVNTGGFYDPLLDLFEHFYRERFAPRVHRDLYYLASTPEDAMHYIETYDDAA